MPEPDWKEVRGRSGHYSGVLSAIDCHFRDSQIASAEGLASNSPPHNNTYLIHLRLAQPAVVYLDAKNMRFDTIPRIGEVKELVIRVSGEETAVTLRYGQRIKKGLLSVRNVWERETLEWPHSLRAEDIEDDMATTNENAIAERLSKYGPQMEVRGLRRRELTDRVPTARFVENLRLYNLLIRDKSVPAENLNVLGLLLTAEKDKLTELLGWHARRAEEAAYKEILRQPSQLQRPLPRDQPSV